MNKKIKQILAMVGVIFLVGLYVMTFIFALIKSPNSTNLFKASFYATIVIPILIYAYKLIFNYLKKK
ncbi:hypothetical protein CG709_03945 [Lachnotalea glycerini]|jgi:hypothetical protein|uniref:Uncharacterized protein n=1 Tax=Lachnotalea glycerini TaxID=1763509 RepID=A0A371JHZ6_9FIRM|nr:hypothetical protein CG709_03945 [Lachnotalea glycerini]RDY32336.1 hypothetical protein CG710_004980 [Lachnotalea glycerini]